MNTEYQNDLPGDVDWTTLEEDFPETAASGAPARYITVLESWSEILRNAKNENDNQITMVDAIRVRNTYDFLALKEIPQHFEVLNSILVEAAEVLRAEIANDLTVLERPGPEEDAEANRAAYLNVMIQWSLLLGLRQAQFDVSADDAAPQLSGFLAATAMLTGGSGLFAWLGEEGIDLKFDEEDQELVREAVAAGLGVEK